MNTVLREPIMPKMFGSAWDRASRRERRIVIVGAVVVAVAVGWMLVWQPLRNDIARTHEERTRMGALLAQARASVEEGVGLARTATKPVTTDPRGAVARAFADNGIRTTAGNVDLRDNRVHVLLPDVRFDALVAALTALARDEGLRAVEATLTTRVEPGTVRAELTLSR